MLAAVLEVKCFGELDIERFIQWQLGMTLFACRAQVTRGREGDVTGVLIGRPLTWKVC